MIKKLKDNKTLVLEDQINHEPKSSNINIAKNKNVDKIYAFHYAIDGNKILLPENIHKVVEKIIEPNNYLVKKIIKSQSNYLRLSIKSSVPEGKIIKAIKALEIILEVKVNRIKLAPNKSLKKAKTK